MPVFALDAPALTVTTSGMTVSFSWSSVFGATGYNLYYAPYPYTGSDTIGSVNMNTQINFTVDLWYGATFYLAVKASSAAEESGYSNVELITIDCVDSDEFIRAKGKQLVAGCGDKPVWLHGVNFDNLHFANWDNAWSDIVNSNHHSQIDFERVADMNMNVIRFGINYHAFELDSAPYNYLDAGFEWLDKNIKWAEDAGVYLILDMHHPQGGYQGGSVDGYALWEKKENQARLIALWREIASRYADRKIIAAYDILNEPSTPGDELKPWQQLAGELITAIRKVDTNHVILVEAGGRGDAFFEIEDDSILLDIHNYYPDLYTKQFENFSNMGPWGKAYPDPELPVPPEAFVWGDSTSYSWDCTGCTDWSYFENAPYIVQNKRFVEAIPNFACYGANSGTVLFDDYFIYEHPPNGGEKKLLIHVDPEAYEHQWDIPDGVDPYIVNYSFWSYFGTDPASTFVPSADSHFGNNSYAMTAGTGEMTATHDMFRIPLRQAYGYSIGGYLKGMAGFKPTNCGMNLEIGALPDGQEWKPFVKSTLEDNADRLQSYAIANNRPFNFGEWGVPRDIWDAVGANNYMADMIAMAKEKNIHLQMWEYRMLYPNPWGETIGYQQGLPDPETANQDLIDVLTKAFAE
ncbi:MAG: glycoside hydrolase family 5 protein [Gammaproteobacteria bacterium]|nr:glycoside hydrolase family 5 protein [Gammaproteobacteria bacterium]